MATDEGFKPPADSQYKIVRLFSNRRTGQLFGGLLLLTLGAAAFAAPWVARSPEWEWTIQSLSDLTGADVNAQVVPLDKGDLYLQRIGDRHISVISPPLSGIAAGRPMVEVTISAVSAAPVTNAGPATFTVNLFWQTAASEPFRMTSSRMTVAGDGSPTRAILTPTVDASTIHRIGVQVEDATQIHIRSIRMVNARIGQRAGFFGQGLVEPEPFGGESVNFYKGPHLLGRSFNYYLVSLCLVSAGVLLIRFAQTRRAISWPAAALAVLIPWIIGDTLFSAQLTRQAAAEAGVLRGMEPERAIRTVYGDELGLAAEWLQIIPRGSRVLVLARDGVTAAHRLAYLAAPRMVPVIDPESADYVVLLDGNATLLNDGTLRLTDSKKELRVRIIERWSGGALLERLPD